MRISLVAYSLSILLVWPALTIAEAPHEIVQIPEGVNFKFKEFGYVGDGGSLLAKFEDASLDRDHAKGRVVQINVLAVKSSYPNQMNHEGRGIFVEICYGNNAESDYREVMPGTPVELKLLQFLRAVYADEKAIQNPRLIWLLLTICDRKVMWYQQALNGGEGQKK